MRAWGIGLQLPDVAPQHRYGGAKSEARELGMRCKRHMVMTKGQMGRKGGLRCNDPSIEGSDALARIGDGARRSGISARRPNRQDNLKVKAVRQGGGVAV